MLIYMHLFFQSSFILFFANSFLFFPRDEDSTAWDKGTEAIFEAVVEGDMDKLQECLANGADVNICSPEV
jgi:hypothetical protein